MAEVTHFRSYEEAGEAISSHETETNNKFVLVARTKNARVSDIQSVGDYVIKFDDTRGDIPIPFDGVPFIQFGTEVRECHQGPNRKRRTLKNTEVKDDHTYNTKSSKKRKYIQVSKKVGCTAQIKMRMVMRFPNHKLQGPYNKKNRTAAVRLLRNATLQEGDKEYTVYMRHCGQHHDHVTGEEAAYCQPLDKTIIEKIKNLVKEDGVRSAAEVKKHLDIMNKSEIPTKNRKFHPTMVDIRNHMYIALHENRFTNDDQRGVMEEIHKWQEARPSDKFFFQPASIDDNGNSRSLLFVHQTPFQQRLLLKYGQEMVLMDSTYKTVRYNVPLFFICVLTNVGYYVVASFIVGHENTSEIKEALNIVQDWNPGWNPQSFMCDLDQREINACESIFKDLSVFTCAFHREQAWDRWLSKVSNGAVADKEHILKMLRNIANSGTEEQMEKNVCDLKESEVFRNNPLLKRWIERFWLHNIKRWARCYRPNSVQVRITTTNGVESINKTFKHRYLKKHGGNKTLMSMLSTLVEDYEPECEENYTRQNVQFRSTARLYSSRIPNFLHDRPHMFVKHCMDRWDVIEDTEIVLADDMQIVGGKHVDTRVPSCECPDFLKTGWPCKHMLSLIKFGKCTWESLPKEYTILPCFNLDDFNEMPVSATGNVSDSKPANISARSRGLELLAEANSLLYCIEDEVILTEANSKLLHTVEFLRKMCPKLQEVAPSVRRKTRKYQQRRQEIKSTAGRKNRPFPDKKKTVTPSQCNKGMHEPITVEDRQQNSASSPTVSQDFDEIDRVLNEILNGSPNEDPIVEVGPFVIRNNSFHYLLQNLSDEVIDASLYSICKQSDIKALHVSCVVWSAIFQGRSHVHGLLRREILSNYEYLVGAVNEGGCHWTLVIIKPKDRQIIYMNPLGEIMEGEQNLMQNWYKFLNERFQEGLETVRPENWEMVTLDHAKQPDGSSCGLYCIQLADNFLRGASLNFHWSASEVQFQRRKLSRRLLSEGVSPSEAVEAVDQLLDDSDTIEAVKHVSFQTKEEDFEAEGNDSISMETLLGTSPKLVPPSEAVEVVDQLLDDSDTIDAVKHVSFQTKEEDFEAEGNDSISMETEEQVPASPVFGKRYHMSLREPKGKRKRSSFEYPEIRKHERKRYCVCNKFNDGRKYWCCDGCHNWFHPACVGKQEEDEDKSFFCPDCEIKMSEDEEEDVEVVDEMNACDFWMDKYDEIMKRVVEIVGCDEKHCNEVEHQRHHSFCQGPESFIQASLKLYLFGREYFSEESERCLFERMAKDLLISRPDPRRPVTGLAISTLKCVPNQSRLGMILADFKIIATKYILHVIMKDFMVFAICLKKGTPFEEANETCKGTEIDFQVLLRKKKASNVQASK